MPALPMRAPYLAKFTRLMVGWEAGTTRCLMLLRLVLMCQTMGMLGAVAEAGDAAEGVAGGAAGAGVRVLSGSCPPLWMEMMCPLLLWRPPSAAAAEGEQQQLLL